MIKTSLIKKAGVALLALLLLVPEMGVFAAGGTTAKAVPVSIAAPLEIPKQEPPSSDGSYSAPSTIPENLPVSRSVYWTNAKDRGVLSSEQLAEMSLTLKNTDARILRIKDKYAGSGKMKNGMAASNLGAAEPRLSDEQVRSLMLQGATTEDVFEAAYLARETGLDPIELYLQKTKSRKSWEDLRTVKQRENKISAEKTGNVTGSVYASSLDVTGDTGQFENALLKAADASLIANSPLTAQINGVIKDFALESIKQLSKPQYSDQDATAETVDPTSTSLIWKSTQISLPGRDGLDLNLGVMYNSTDSEMEQVNFNNTIYNLGTGWSFRFPSIQPAPDNKYYYRDGEGSIYESTFSANDTGLEAYTHLKGYKGKDRQLVQDLDHSYSNGQFSSTYYMEYPDKKREYFGGPNNRLLAIVDRFGNTITFRYSPEGMLSYIQDTVGRKMTFTYDNQAVYSVENNNANPITEKLVVQVYDASGSPQQKVTYSRIRVGHTFINGHPDGVIDRYWAGTPFIQLQSITLQSGEEINFRHYDNYYLYHPTLKTSDVRDPDTGFLYFDLLSSVEYTHSQSVFVWGDLPGNLMGKGNIHHPSITERYDQLKKGSGFSGKYNDLSYEHDRYSDGYPDYFKDEYSSSIPDTYTYSTIIKNLNGQRTTTYTFNNKDQLMTTKAEAANGEKIIDKNTGFHAVFTQSPTTSEHWEYGIGDTDITANKLYSETSYDDLGYVTSTTRPVTGEQWANPTLRGKNTTTYEYDSSFHLISRKTWYKSESDPLPLTETYLYHNGGDKSGRLETYTGPDGTTGFTYEMVQDGGAGGNKVSKVTAIRTAGGKLASRSVTTFGSEYGYAYPTVIQQLFNVSLPTEKAITTTKKYDAATGLVTEQKDSNGQTTNYDYDNQGRIKKITYPKMISNDNGTPYQDTEEYNYYPNMVSDHFDETNAGIHVLKVDTFKIRTQLTSGAKSITYCNYLYNGLGMLLTQEQWDEYQAKWTFDQFHYNESGQATYAKDKSGNTVTAGYDVWGRQNLGVDEFANRYISEYDLKQRKTTNYRISAADGKTWNRVEETQNPWGQVTSRTTTYTDLHQKAQTISEQYRYDLAGNLTGYTDPNQNMNEDGVTTSFVYDGLNRLAQVKNALNQSTFYIYDGNNQITKVSMQEKGGAPQTLKTGVYNEVGLPIAKQDGLGQSESLSYNSMGQLEQRTDRNSTVISNHYNEAGVLDKTVWSGTVNGAAANREVRLFLGDSRGSRYNTTRWYDNNVAAPSVSQTNLFDSLDRLRWVDSQGNGYSSQLNLKRDILGQVIQQISTSSAFGNFYTNYTYNKTRVETVQTDGKEVPSGNETAKAWYTYEGNGLVSSIRYPLLSDGTTLKAVFVHDANLNWLQQVTNTKGDNVLTKYEYEYDCNGNIMKVTEQGSDRMARWSMYTYDALNRLKTVTRSDGSAAEYMYDLRGNRNTLSDTSPGSTDFSAVSYSYDLMNTLTGLTKNNVSTNFAYLPDGLRYQKSSGGNTTQYGYNANGEVVTETKGNEKAEYVRGDRLLVKKDVTISTAVKDYYYLYNGHGDVVQIVDTTGKVLNSYGYDEWGNLTSQIEGISNSFKYAGEMYDDETGLYYLRARYYDPGTGRFLNEDTYEGQIDNPLSLNLYTYVSNNPLIYTDPTGHRKASDNDELAGYTQQYADDYEKAKRNGDKEGMVYAEKMADTMRVSYYRMYGLEVPSDVKYTDASLKMQKAFRFGYFTYIAAARMPPQSFFNGESPLNVAYLTKNPEFIANLGPDNVAKIFQNEGFEVTKATLNSGNGVKLMIKGNQINYIQFSNGEGRHGVPYIKVNGNEIKVKIVIGNPGQYKGNVQEEIKTGTRFYWLEGNQYKGWRGE
ncbi:RHS repeat-associated core domain-containing protein [Paenibacillus spiritus]|uniref:RHS repeat-associated core domain-containing protein n=1 Tax=Paenibacillus spiritus TaxID=2496557 RepID=A0A5J5GDQ8_9BACL|nr:RHS repeat-associated core domain-containing protein [Paenibacillus spiritus]KAA9006329.1 RHS repeat-associated core domain-containing protein [Paenibacillus spiritus]